MERIIKRKSHIKKVDDRGNVEIPAKFLRQLGIDNEAELEIILDGDRIMIKKK